MDLLLGVFGGRPSAQGDAARTSVRGRIHIPEEKHMSKPANMKHTSQLVVCQVQKASAQKAARLGEASAYPANCRKATRAAALGRGSFLRTGCIVSMALTTDMIPRNQMAVISNKNVRPLRSPSRAPRTVGYDGNLLRASLGSFPNGRIAVRA